MYALTSILWKSPFCNSIVILFFVLTRCSVHCQFLPSYLVCLEIKISRFSLSTSYCCTFSQKFPICGFVLKFIRVVDRSAVFMTEYREYIKWDNESRRWRTTKVVNDGGRRILPWPIRYLQFFGAGSSVKNWLGILSTGSISWFKLF